MCPVPAKLGKGGSTSRRGHGPALQDTMAWLWRRGRLVGVIRAGSPAPRGLPCWLQRSPLPFALPSLSGPLASLGLTLDGYCSLADLWRVVDPAGLGLSPSLAFLPVCLEAGHLTL